MAKTTSKKSAKVANKAAAKRVAAMPTKQRKTAPNTTATKGITAMPNQNQVKYMPAGTGPMYRGPGDRVTFLVTGAESGGACFIIEGMAPPGGGPPPHIHHFEDESFYILEGTATFHAGGQTIHAKPGDFIHIPRGTVHSLRNDGEVPARALIVISPAGPAGMQRFFEESFYPATDRSASPPLITEELVRRMTAAAARNGMEFVKPV
jgi:quercetin dioxygenase-like cupin family protein